MDAQETPIFDRVVAELGWSPLDPGETREPIDRADSERTSSGSPSTD